MKIWHTSRGTSVARILFGRCNVYLISCGENRLLVDTGIRGDARRLVTKLAATGKPAAVVMTHTHFDHAGGAGLLMESFAPRFIVQEEEKGYLESGDSPIPRGNAAWTRLLFRLGPHRVPQWFHVTGVPGPITYTERYDLAPFGVPGYVMHTPGHSSGSAAVIVDEEIALVGDTLGGMPGAVFPPWADDGPELIRSWKKLLGTGCHTFHPAHGFPITRERLEKEYLRLQHLLQ